MISSEFTDMRIKGICCALPEKHVDNRDYIELFGSDAVDRIIASSGITGSYMCTQEQTASDLCYAAAQKLLDAKGIDPQSIDVLLFVTAYTDYIAPSTAFVLQKRLGLSMDCIVYDINLGCSGFVSGLQTLCSLLQCSSGHRGLLLVGDSTSKSVSPQDKTRLLFGDAGAAVYVEKTGRQEEPMRFALRSDGNRYQSIIIPAGGFRYQKDASHDMRLWDDGNIRSDYNLYMGGPDVFSFSLQDVPQLFKDFCAHFEVNPSDFDCLLLHQANLFMIKHIARKLKVPMEKIPVSLDRFGNSSGATIPVTICDAYVGHRGLVHALMSGFGVGLSWGVASICLDTEDILPLFHTGESYAEGDVSRN